jgi:hypothetical protein
VAWLTFDAPIFAANFDRRPFYLAHRLADHRLMELPEIAALSERLPQNLVEWNVRGPRVYGRREPGGPPTKSCAEAIRRVGEVPAWVLLREIEHDPDYRDLLDELLDEVKPLSEPYRAGMCQREAFLFVSSSEAVTPFHFDPEHNFLLQVRGHKTVHMWDPTNRWVLPAAALDAHYAARPGSAGNRDQPYRADFLASAWVLPLRAGQGLHFPLHAPHMVKTESEVSISLSITFRSRRSKFRAAVHAANGHVRMVGLNPPEPGVSHLWDVTANVGYRSYRTIRSHFGRLRRGLRRF